MDVKTLLVASAFALGAGIGTAWADDIVGPVESIDTEARSFNLQGVTVYTDGRTEYEDGLSRFEDLQAGQEVEVEINIRDGRHLAEEIELKRASR